VRAEIRGPSSLQLSLSTFLPRPWCRVSSPSSWPMLFLIHSHSSVFVIIFIANFGLACFMTTWPCLLSSLHISTRQVAHFFMYFLNRRPSLTPLLPQRTQPYHTAAAPIGRLRGLTLHCLTARPHCMDIIVMSQGCVPVSLESLVFLSPFFWRSLLAFSGPLAFQFYLHFRFILGLRGSTVDFCVLCPSFYMEQGLNSALGSSFSIHFIVIVSLFRLAPDFTLPIVAINSFTFQTVGPACGPV
jgi:hypothetical protein